MASHYPTLIMTFHFFGGSILSSQISKRIMKSVRNRSGRPLARLEGRRRAPTRIYETMEYLRICIKRGFPERKGDSGIAV